MNLSSDYYKAVFHLSKYPGEATEKALLSLLKIESYEQPIKLAQRKAIEVLGLLNCQKSIPLIGTYLNSKDPYIVENAAWALQLLKCNDDKLHQTISSLLDKPDMNRRVLIQSLANMGVINQIDRIKKFIDDEFLPNNVKGAAIAAFTKLSGNKKYVSQLKKIIFSPNQNDRQTVVQDIINSDSIELLPYVISSPISPFFKLRAVSNIWPLEKENILGLNLLDVIDNLIIDHPYDIQVLHKYENYKSIDFLINQFFNTDFSRAYLALKTIMDKQSIEIWEVLPNYLPRIKKDYGALYFLICLFNLVPLNNKDLIEEISEILYYSINNNWSKFIKFRPLAIKTLIAIQPFESNKYLPQWLDSLENPYWPCRYAALMQIEKLLLNQHEFDLTCEKSIEDENPFVSLKAKSIFMKLNK